jgi:hypothetical protein
MALASVPLPEVSVDHARATAHGNRSGARPHAVLDPATDARPSTITLAAKERSAIQLRTRGHTFQQIADALGLKSRSAARKCVIRGLGRWMREADEELREIEVARLDLAMQRLWPVIEQEDDDLALRAVEKLVRVIDLRARITGLYQPRQKHQPVAAITKELAARQGEEMVAAVERLMAATGQVNHGPTSVEPERATISSGADSGTG